MPCDSVVKMEVNLKQMDHVVLKRALEKDGWTVALRRDYMLAYKDGRRIEIHRDRAVVDQGDEDLVEKMNDAYSREAVRTAFAKFGFKVEQSKTVKNQDIMTKATFGKSSFKKSAQKTGY